MNVVDVLAAVLDSLAPDHVERPGLIRAVELARHYGSSPEPADVEEPGIRHFEQTLYTLRDEDGTRNHLVRREIEMALRWKAPAFDRVDGKKGPENPPGIRALHDLDDGGTPLTAERVQAAVLMLDEAIAWYESGPWEPFKGRNAEALADLTTLAATLRRALNPSHPITEETAR